MSFWRVGYARRVGASIWFQLLIAAAVHYGFELLMTVIGVPSRGSGWRVRSRADIQRRRLRTSKQGFLFASTNESPQSLISVPWCLRDDAKAMVASKALKVAREAEVGSSLHSRRLASVAA